MIIYIYPDITDIEHVKGGPEIGMQVLQRNIKHIINNLKISFIKFTKDKFKNNCILWHWLPFYNTTIFDYYKKNNVFLICGPNTIFRHPGIKIEDDEKKVLTCKNVGVIITHTEDSSITLLKHFKRSIKNYIIPYPVKSNILIDYNKTRTIDILIYKKHNCENTYKFIFNQLKDKYNIKIIEYKNYKIKELIDLSSISKCCIYLSYGESGGIAVLEILSSGCPIISFKSNLGYGIDKKDCYQLNSNDDFYNIEYILELYNKCLLIDNKELAINTRNKFNETSVSKKTVDILNEIYLDNL